MSRLFVLLSPLVVAVSTQQESESNSHWGMVTCFLIVVLVLLSIVGLYCCKKWSVAPPESNKAKNTNRKTSPRKDNLLKRWYNTIDENKRKEALTINQKHFGDLPVTSARRTSLSKSKSKYMSKSQHKKSKRHSSLSRNSKSSSSINHKSSQSIKSRDTTVTNKKAKSSKKKHERKKRSNNRSPR